MSKTGKLKSSLLRVKSKSLSKLSAKRLSKLSRVSSLKEPEYPVNFLKEDFISLHNVKLRNIISRDAVPPQTPNSEYEFEETISPIPPFPDLDELELPYVRDKGVKYCIDYFGQFFKCFDYSTNYLQFWFLDILTDCVWCLQDEYLLPDDLQKTVLQWFLYFLDLLRNQNLNLSRKKFFTIFKDAILIAAETVDEGCITILPPQKVFQIMDEDQSEVESSDLDSSLSSIVINQCECAAPACIVVKKVNEPFKYELLPERCHCDDFELSTIYTLTESDSKPSEAVLSTYIDQDGQIDDDLGFYKPDLEIPARFLETFDEAIEEEEEENYSKKSEASSSKSEHVSNTVENENNFAIYEVEDKFDIITKSCSKTESIPSDVSNLTATTSSESTIKADKSVEEKLTDQDILKALAMQKLMEQRLLDMSDPRKGWVPWKSDLNISTGGEENLENEEEEEDQDDEWVDMILKNNEEFQIIDDNAVLNFGVLWAIIEIIFKYFQFALVKMAFHATPELITQKVSNTFNVMKVNKIPVRRPPFQPKPVPPVSSEKKKSEDLSIKPSSSRKLSVAQSKTPLSTVSEKLKLTPAEIKAIKEKERLEALRLKEEMKKMEENKKYLFPLKEGVDEDFFHQLFPNAVIEKEKKSTKSSKAAKSTKTKKK